MYHRLSNAADREEMERVFGLKFKYPKLYSPNMIIDGMTESILSVITMQDSEHINYAIWGLMPDDYKEDWKIFQNGMNTLNINVAKLSSIKWMKNLLMFKRSLVLVSGFFTYFLKKGKLYPYYVSSVDQKPFCIAGIYSTLDDGFLSCSIITTKTDKFIANYHNLHNEKPLLIPSDMKDLWLSESTETDLVNDIIKNPPAMELRANPIAGEFFKKNIVYDSLLNPVYYEGIPGGNTSSKF